MRERNVKWQRRETFGGKMQRAKYKRFVWKWIIISMQIVIIPWLLPQIFAKKFMFAFWPHGAFFDQRWTRHRAQLKFDRGRREEKCSVQSSIMESSLGFFWNFRWMVYDAALCDSRHSFIFFIFSFVCPVAPARHRVPSLFYVTASWNWLPNAPRGYQLRTSNESRRDRQINDDVFSIAAIVALAPFSCTVFNSIFTIVPSAITKTNKNCAKLQFTHPFMN